MEPVGGARCRDVASLIYAGRFFDGGSQLQGGLVERAKLILATSVCLGSSLIASSAKAQSLKETLDFIMAGGVFWTSPKLYTY